MKRLLLICLAALAQPAFCWQKVAGIQDLEQEHQILCAKTIKHGVPHIHLSLRNNFNAKRTFRIESRISRCAPGLRTLALGPGESVTLTLPQVFSSEFDRGYYARQITITEPNPPKGITRNDTFGYIQFNDEFDFADAYGSHSEQNNLLLDPSLSHEQLQNTFALARGIKDDKGKLQPFTFHGTKAPEAPGLWPTDYRDYLTFDAVLAPASTLQALSPSVRLALTAYERLGGKLITTEENQPAGFSTSQAALDAIADFQKANTRMIGDLKFKSYGYGSGNRATENLARIPLNIQASLPVGFIILLLVIFSVVVVPFCVWHFAKRNRRILLLAVLPAASAALALGVGIIALFTYGTTPITRLQSVTFLDQRTRLAVTRGQFGVFAPGSIDGEMSIPNDATLTLRDTDGSNFKGTLAYAETPRLDGTWVKPLTVAFFDFSRARQHAEKLDVRPGPDESVTVVNLLGAPALGGWLRRGENRYRIPPLAPGESAELAPTEKTHVPFTDWQEHLLSSDTDFGRNWHTLGLLANSPSVSDGTYILHLNASPFFPNLFGRRPTKGTEESIVIGTFAEDVK